MNRPAIWIQGSIWALSLWLVSATQAAPLSAVKKTWLEKFEKSVVCVCRERGSIQYKSNSIGSCNCEPGQSEYLSFKSELAKVPDDPATIRNFFYTALVKIVNKYQTLAIRGQADSDKVFLKQMAKLRCVCGDCPFRPMDECNCGFAQNWRRVMRVQFDSGETFEQIAAFYAKANNSPYDRVLTRPNKALSWVVPVSIAVLVLLGLGIAIRGWTKRSARAEATTAAPAAVDEGAQQRLREAMRKRDMER